MSGWTFADVWEHHAVQRANDIAQAHGDRVVSWAEMSRRANGVARVLLDAGIEEQSRVAQFLGNVPEYLESVFATFKAGFVPVNTNYRYQGDELVYLWTNAGCSAVIFQSRFTDAVASVRDRVPAVREWLWVDDGTNGCPEWATPYEGAAQAGTDSPVRGPWGRTPDQLFLCYTGGTTGKPKGVMWRQEDFFLRTNSYLPDTFDPAALDNARRIVSLPACPLMHATALNTQLSVLSAGGSTVLLPQDRFDPRQALDTIERRRVGQIVIVGDVFAMPLVEELDRNPQRWDLSSLRIITSSGTMFSSPIKQRLLKHTTRARIIDFFSSSEALGMAAAVTKPGEDVQTARFTPSDDVIVLDEAGARVEPGSGVQGRVAITGRQPLGYYNDKAKTDVTFVVHEGRRYSIPGDWATVEADGSLHLLGRGSMCINTGGEKVFSEEVEEALKTHPSVRDAVVVGVPDPRLGERVVGVVEPTADAAPNDSELIAHVRAQLAGFKTPKAIVFVETLGRAANGKADYGRLRQEAIEQTSNRTTPLRGQL